MYHITLPEVTMHNVDWWALANKEKFIVNHLASAQGKIYIYLDRTLPPRQLTHLDNFPQQMFMRMKMPFQVAAISLKNFKL